MHSFGSFCSAGIWRRRGDLQIRKIGKAPNFITLSPDGTKIYVTSYATDELVVVDLKQRLITQSVSVGASPLGLAIAEEGKTALVACRMPEPSR